VEILKVLVLDPLVEVVVPVVPVGMELVGLLAEVEMVA